MTWQHLQQLRSAARARIQERLAAARPQGGRGAVVQGSNITLYGGRPGAAAPEPAPWTLVINVTIDYEFHGRDSEGAFFSSGSYPRERAVLVPRPQFVPLLRTYALEGSQFNYNESEDENTWMERRVRVKFDTLVFPVATTNPNYQLGRDAFEGGYYRMPVRIRVDHVSWVSQREKVYDSKWLVVDRNGTVYEPRPTENNIPFELKIAEVQLL